MHEQSKIKGCGNIPLDVFSFSATTFDRENDDFLLLFPPILWIVVCFIMELQFVDMTGPCKSKGNANAKAF